MCVCVSGTKNVAKSMKISCGTKKTKENSWFVELSDKCKCSVYLLVSYSIDIHVHVHLGKSTKVHLYYCMKNCAQSPMKLRENILNIVEHYHVSQKYIILLSCMS